MRNWVGKCVCLQSETLLIINVVTHAHVMMIETFKGNILCVKGTIRMH